MHTDVQLLVSLAFRGNALVTETVTVALESAC